MKKIILLLAYSLSLFSYESYTEKLDYIVDNVQTQQINLDTNKLSKIKDPFVVKRNEKVKNLKTNIKTSKTKKAYIKRRTTYSKKLPFGVEGIFDNSVLIKGKWYKQGQYVSKRFLVKKIYEDKVELKDKYSKKIYKIKIGELNEKIQINIF